MIDIHCHILPKVDDGPDDVRDSLEMAKMAAGEGISTIVATPHHQNGSYHNVKADIIQKTRDFNEYLKTESIDIKILPGQETRIYGELLEDFEKGEILTIAQSSMYVFVELPSSHVPRYTEQLLYDIQIKGLIPIIVHPERNSELMEQPDKLYKLVKNGAATQVTAASLTGYFGKRTQKFTEEIIEANLTHFIASDAHNTVSRSFKMAEAQELLKKKFGTDTLFMFMDNAESVVADQHIFREIPSRIKKKKSFWIF
ncbi:tyrosine protein phosphatase [Siminovitchia acidinfaciens]|uniref:Tyrosine-protein phosphatase n=1 Tax=Siminovitchia acidinfaciens TaxID=2321395 RepID=A0A429XZI3_9BACI|nr:CpsB/CapC family capsule biosynthesis tyrosine phosphatase [Siminovitchia acidinfaciens]RST74193.1 tyrosine protein phosphatase [Siminovitchia acidinfaciens]